MISQPPAAQPQAAQLHAAQSDAAQSDAARSGAARSGAVRSDAVRSDAARSGAARSDAARSDAARSDAARSGAAQPHLAQLNIARLVAPLDDPRLAGFVEGLDRINGLADQAPGFVWRLVEEGADDATGLRPFGDDVIVNLTVWTGLEALFDFTYRSGHLDYLRQRREWFVPFGEAFAVVWWVPEGHLPDVAEAGARLTLLRDSGPTPDAFTLRAPFPAPPFPAPPFPAPPFPAPPFPAASFPVAPVPRPTSLP